MASGTAAVREAQAADVGAIAGLLREAFVEFETLYDPKAFEATLPSADRLLDRHREGPVWVAELNGALAGTVSGVPAAQSLYIRSMAVKPSMRGRGVGAKLLGELERFAAARAVERLYLSTTPFLVDAIALYERAGFVRTEEEPHALFDTPLFTMQKLLLPAAVPGDRPA